MTMHEVISEFFAEQEYKGNRPATLTFYRVNFNHFLQDTGVINLEDFTERSIRAWLLSHRGLGPNTMGAYDRALRSLCNWLHLRGYVDMHPMKNLPKPKSKRIELVAFTDDEIRRIFAEAKRLHNPLRDRALMSTLLDTGVRIGEACGLELHHIQWQEQYLGVDGKTGPRQIPFGRKTKQALKLYIEQERKVSSRSIYKVFLNRDGTPFKSTTATQHLGKIANRVGVKSARKSAHMWRHSFAVEYIRAGGDAFTLQMILGHSSLEMTRKYVHLAQTDLREAHRKFSPGNRLL